jgi:hypothetical protein
VEPVWGGRKCVWWDARLLKVQEEKTFTYRQIRALISPLPVANNPPVGLGATEITTQRGYGQLRLT